MMWLAAICIALVTGLGLSASLPLRRSRLILLVGLCISVVALYALLGTPSV